MNCNIIGAGRLGKNLGIATSVHQIAVLDSICNTNFLSASKACNEIGFGKAVAKISDLPKVDVTWIVCKDDAIAKVVSILDKEQILKKGSLVIHCSGTLNSNILDPLKQQGCYTASLHPLKAFCSHLVDPNAFMQTHCVIEGDHKACDWLKSIFEKLGASVLTIQPEAKAIYHAAATIASNYLVTLAAYSEKLFLEAGITQQQSRNMICNLMQSNISNIHQMNSIKNALTGPLTRGDMQTIALHLNAINNDEINTLYRTMALATLPLSDLPTKTKEALIALLKSCGAQ